MNTSRLKSIVIAILALLNACLLVLLVGRRMQERSMREHTVAQLVALFAENGVTLDPNCIPESEPLPSPVEPARDLDGEASFAAALLGSCDREDVGGGIYRYVSEGGQALLRSSGLLEASPGLRADDPAAFAASLFQRFGYSATDSDLSGGSGTLSAVREVSGLTVFNARLTLTFHEGTLIAADGLFIPAAEALAAEPQSSSVDAVTALVRFLDYSSLSGEVCTAVTDVRGGYLLQSTTSLPQLLVPVWRVTTDVSRYYVNMLTGEVLREA